MDINPERIIEWVYVLIAIIGLWKMLKAKDRADKWQFIRESVPEIHNVVQKLAAVTPTKKDDLFVEKMNELLEAAGWKIHKKEERAVKSMGEGFHQMGKHVPFEGPSTE